MKKEFMTKVSIKNMVTVTDKNPSIVVLGLIQKESQIKHQHRKPNKCSKFFIKVCQWTI